MRHLLKLLATLYIAGTLGTTHTNHTHKKKAR